MPDEYTKQLALDTLTDLVADFLRRKEDEELSQADLQALFATGKLTVDECTAIFKAALEYQLR